ncbi:MAG TPA: RNA 2',3'-cyclic phosphodiesterase [Deltaproteobacteria bacterium]|nr:RNA 2',3'-cyclic phosphodiesterase [Deltaproteobacteria bacterium]
MGEEDNRRIRAFVAVEIPDFLRDELRRLARELRRGGSAASWVRPENVHLTLKFLGQVDEALVGPLGEAVAGAASGVRPFRLTTGRVGAFPSLAAPRVVWLGVEPCEALSLLHRRIDDALGELGFERESRPFRPHLTLCRIRSAAEGRRLGRFIGRTAPAVNASFLVESVTLFKSVLGAGGPRYAALARARLDTS